MQITISPATKTYAARRALPRHWLRRAARRAIDLLHEWRRRRDGRMALAAFDERMLRDIGIIRADAMREIDQPFWRK